MSDATTLALRREREQRRPASGVLGSNAGSSGPAALRICQATRVWREFGIADVMARVSGASLRSRGPTRDH